MSSREHILSRIRKGKPDSAPLPELKLFSKSETTSWPAFKSYLEKTGGKMIEIHSETEIRRCIQQEYGFARHIYSNSAAVESTIQLRPLFTPKDLDKLDLAIIRGEVAVGENAAIYVRGNSLAHPIIPFIAHHLIISISKEAIVGNMHEAFRKISPDKQYGVFISGPSKTADIEQSLVIGAHGPKSLLVIVVNEL